MAKPIPVLVEWHDARDLEPRWLTRRELDPEPTLVRSVGWQLRPDPVPDHLTLALSLTGDHVGGGINIPRSCIVKVRKL